MSILSAVLLVVLLITLYRCRVPWFEPVSKLIDKYTTDESFFPAYRGRELDNIAISNYLTSQLPPPPGEFVY